MTARRSVWMTPVLATALVMGWPGTAAAQEVGYLLCGESVNEATITLGDLSEQSVGPALADSTHVNEALVLSFGHGVMSSGGGGGGTATITHAPLEIVKPVSSSSVEFSKALVQGTLIPTCVLSLYRDESGASIHYFTITLTSAQIVQITPRAAGAGVTTAGAPTHLESVAISYGTIKWRHEITGTDWTATVSP